MHYKIRRNDKDSNEIENRYTCSILKKYPGLVVSWSLVKKNGETLGLVKLRLARKLQPLVFTYCGSHEHFVPEKKIICIQ